MASIRINGAANTSLPTSTWRTTDSGFLTRKAYGSSRAVLKGVADGREFGEPIRYSRIYVKRDGRWQVVLFQQTRVGEKK